MSRGRFNIGGDALPFTSPSFGLLSPATTQLETPSTNKWKMGLQWRAICPGSGGTFGECTTIDGDVLPAAKAETWDQETRGATPITVYSRVDCAPVGEWDDLSERNRQSLLRSEERELERIFWTGEIEGSGVVTAFPHLAANANVLDGDDLLQPLADVVTPVPQPIEVGVGMLEAAMRECYPGVATLHVPLRLGSLMAEASLLRQNGGTAFTTSVGSKVVLGNYPGTSPAGDDTPGVTWIFATGNVFYQREPAPHTFRPVESLDRNVNTLSMIAERTYVIGWDCCLMAIPIQNGEDVTP